MLSHAGTRAIAFLTIALAASFSEAASIRYDLRAVQDGSVGATVRDPKNVQVSSPNGVVKMQLWAMVENLNGINEDDGFTHGHLSVISAGGAFNLLGDLTAFCLPPFDSKFSQLGLQADLDADGDLDVGTNAQSNANVNAFFIPDSGYLDPNTSGPLSTWVHYPSDAKSAETFAGKDFSSFLIGSALFAFDGVNSESTLSTNINVRARVRLDGLKSARKMHLFGQDGQRITLAGDDPMVITGEAVHILTHLTSAVPEPSSMFLSTIGILGIAVAMRRRRGAARNR